MSYGELRFGPIYTGRDRTTGRFLKGCVPANKGMTWDEFMPKRSQRRSAKGWKNLEKHRCKGGGPNSGRPKKRVVAVMDSGKWVVFPSISAAGKWLGGRTENVGRCCRGNALYHANTDHRYMGIRFYFESNDIWIQKVNSKE